MALTITVFWNITPCRLVVWYVTSKRFWGNVLHASYESKNRRSLILGGCLAYPSTLKMEGYIHLKCRQTCTRLRGVKSQKTKLFEVTAVRSSALMHNLIRGRLRNVLLAVMEV
jgi:hypothetical protein